MKPLSSFLILLLISGLLLSCDDEISDLQKDTFVKFYGSYQNDQGRDVAALPTGGYAITGNIVPDTMARMVLILTDDAGNQVEGSPHTYGGAFQTSGNTLLVLEDGYLIGGTITDTTSDKELQTDMFLVRTDAAGSVIWSRRYGGEENDVLNHVAERHSSGFVLAGKKTTNEEEDLWIMTVDEQGKKLYECKAKDRDDDDEANFIFRVDGGYLVACTYDEGAMEGTDIYIVSLDENLSIIDSKALGTEDDDIARKIISYAGGYLVLGYTENTSTGLNEIKIYSFDTEQNYIRNARLFATIADADLTPEDFVLNANGLVAVFGTRESNENKDMYLFLLNETGKMVDAPRQFGALDNQSGYGIDRTNDGGLVFTGNNSIGGNSLIALIKTDASGDL